MDDSIAVISKVLALRNVHFRYNVMLSDLQQLHPRPLGSIIRRCLSPERTLIAGPDSEAAQAFTLRPRLGTDAQP